MRTDDLFAFIQERYKIYLRKNQGLPKPWTSDTILQSYRFCNVYREWDTQTEWFAENWREPHEDDEDLWFMSLVFRFINWGETAEELGYYSTRDWDPFYFKRVLNARKRRGQKIYSGAYMISTHGVKEPKSSYLAKSLTKIYKNRSKIRYQPGELLSSFHTRLMNCFDVGSFIAGQVIADVKYTPRYMDAPDWWTFAASGPGSRRGLNRVCHNPLKTSWQEEDWYNTFFNIFTEINPLIDAARMPRLHAQDLQNCLCEFDKYERVRLGEGRPKSKYNGVR